ncbi:hypothetical protein BDW02DRAFT_86725 [Decorospora gaudefroyi]|uniref:Uncharacterized protein n=1 Tax=Decorospora gaudefroyi TaxID=184978 RepID=A0A6A5K1Y5_9PLEO|nr:hypothetical protein BDW02DRAFT_86725 [Decorospora gaudefroyi]
MTNSHTSSPGESDRTAIYNQLAETCGSEMSAERASAEAMPEDQEYQKLITKGSRLRELMMVDPSEDLKSKFHEYTDLGKWGYVQNHFRNSALTKIDTILEDICVQLESADDFGDNDVTNHDHSESVEVEGFIVAYDNHSPRSCLRNDATQPLPDLRFWSDVAYLQWLSRAEPDSDLRYVLRYDVVNDTTLNLVQNLEDRHSLSLSEWPGKTYESGSQEFDAFLGTPNGSSTAYMLVQRKEELGHKTVEKITVFRTNAWEVMLLFHIGYVEVHTDDQ